MYQPCRVTGLVPICALAGYVGAAVPPDDSLILRLLHAGKLRHLLADREV